MINIKSKTINHTLVLIGGWLILIFPIFFFNNFAISWLAAYSYPVFVIIGLSISIYFFSKLVHVKSIYTFLFLIFLEGSIYSCFQLIIKGFEIPAYVVANLKYIYNARMVNVIQFDPILSSYDDELFYKLNLGDHTFSNLEFKTNFSVNSIGVRDDEESIHSPRIICIGDSFTMGWGVENKNTFSSILEERSNSKTLNLGISSYGTAIELLSLNKTNLDSCHTLIIQFWENDIIENRSFIGNNYKLKISSKEGYSKAQRTNHLKKHYFPFKLSFELLAKIIRSISGYTQKKFNKKPILDIKDPSYMQDLFSMIGQIQQKFSGQILLFIPESNSIPEKYKISPQMTEYLKKHPRQNITIFDSAKVLTDNDFFHFDAHLNNQGHQKIADALLKLLEAEQ